MEKVKVSFILPVYNVEKYLKRCLDTLINQTLKDIEIICVHDGSKDNSMDILKEYRKNHDNIIILDKENEGAYRARVDGIKLARGEYIGFVDPDDYVSNDYAEKMYLKIKESGSDIVCCGFERIDEITGKIYSREMDQYSKKFIDVSKNPEGLLAVNTAVWNKLYRRKLLESIDCFNEITPVILDDCNLLMLIYMKVKTISFIDNILYYYIVRQGGIIKSINNEKIHGAKNAMLKIKQLYIKNTDKSLLEIVDLMVFLHLGVSLMYFISNTDSNFKKTLKETRIFLDKEFPLWKKSRYLKLSYAIKSGFNIKLSVVRLIYKCHLFRAFMAVYRCMINRLHIDIKW